MMVNDFYLTTTKEKLYKFDTVKFEWTDLENEQVNLLILFDRNKPGFLTETFLIVKCYGEGYISSFLNTEIYGHYARNGITKYVRFDTSMFDYTYAEFINFSISKNTTYSVNSEETEFLPLTGLELRFITNFKINHYSPTIEGCEGLLVKIKSKYEKQY